MEERERICKSNMKPFSAFLLGLKYITVGLMCVRVCVCMQDKMYSMGRTQQERRRGG